MPYGWVKDGKLHGLLPAVQLAQSHTWKAFSAPEQIPLLCTDTIKLLHVRQGEKSKPDERRGSVMWPDKQPTPQFSHNTTYKQALQHLASRNGKPLSLVPSVSRAFLWLFWHCDNMVCSWHGLHGNRKTTCKITAPTLTACKQPKIQYFPYLQ